MSTGTPLIDPSSAIPLYAQVEAVLASDIAGGTLSPGSQLPTETDLIERFGVSRPTVRKAVQNLVSRGLVEIQRGKGTYVTRPKITQELTALTGFVEDMQALGRHPTARVLDKQGEPVEGLYAAGNDMESIFSGDYPGGGVTIGPAMVFGYIAARHLAGLPIAGQPEGTAARLDV